jgi:hypothetical protein
MTATVSKDALEAVIEYLWQTEERDYQESDRPDNHIYHSLVSLKESLDEVSHRT